MGLGYVSKEIISIVKGFFPCPVKGAGGNKGRVVAGGRDAGRTRAQSAPVRRSIPVVLRDRGVSGLQEIHQLRGTVLGDPLDVLELAEVDAVEQFQHVIV